MPSKSSPLPSELVQLHPGIGILRLAALSAEGQGDIDAESLDSMFVLMEAGVLEDIRPADMWPELARGLMASEPARMIITLRECGALQTVLPEVAGLFGVPDLADNADTVDLGQHLLNALGEAARCRAPLEVRFALLVRNVGKIDSPKEHLPVHYRHIERGHPRIEAVCDRFGVPEPCRELALLALHECERVHRVSEIRAGPIALMLERLHAFDDVARFRNMMTLCACDFRGIVERAGQTYAKAAVLEKALSACADIDEVSASEDTGAADAADALRTARAEAIAEALRSERWSS